MSYLFGDQLLLTLIAFAAAFWTGARLVTRNVPIAGVLVLAFVGALFLSDLSVFISTDMVGAVAVLGIMVFLAQHMLRLTLLESVAVTSVAAVMGAMLVYNVF